MLVSVLTWKGFELISTCWLLCSDKKTEVDNSVNFEAPDSTAIAARGLPAPIASLSSSGELI